MTTKQLKNRGFTLVELLIVIVIIAILTVISLIAYNGIQNQAKTSASQGVVKNVADKAQIYNTEENGYPEKIADMSASGKSGKAWYFESQAYTETGDTAPTTAPTGENAAKQVAYKVCKDAHGNKVGAKIWGWNFSTNDKIERTIGTVEGC